jgi:hypothetical protein
MLLQISLAVALLFVVLVVWREGLVRRVVLVRIPLLLALWVLPWAMPLSRSELFANPRGHGGRGRVVLRQAPALRAQQGAATTRIRGYSEERQRSCGRKDAEHGRRISAAPH